MIKDMQNLPPAVVERFLETRNAEACEIPAPLAEYILQVNEAANLFRRNTSVSGCAEMLRKKYPDISFSTAKSRVYDAINYLHADSSVTSESWNNFFADQMMSLRDVALLAHDIKEARLCMIEARKYRIEASASNVNPSMLKYKPQIVSPDVELERMGVKRNGLLAAYSKAVDLIKKQDIPDSEKKRMVGEVSRELGIQDVQDEAYESVQN
jgi:hypothetical protein